MHTRMAALCVTHLLAPSMAARIGSAVLDNSAASVQGVGVDSETRMVHHDIQTCTSVSCMGASEDVIQHILAQPAAGWKRTSDVGRGMLLCW